MHHSSLLSCHSALGRIVRVFSRRLQLDPVSNLLAVGQDLNAQMRIPPEQCGYDTSSLRNGLFFTLKDLEACSDSHLIAVDTQWQTLRHDQALSRPRPLGVWMPVTFATRARARWPGACVDSSSGIGSTRPYPLKLAAQLRDGGCRNMRKGLAHQRPWL